MCGCVCGHVCTSVNMYACVCNHLCVDVRIHTCVCLRPRVAADSDSRPYPRHHRPRHWHVSRRGYQWGDGPTRVSDTDPRYKGSLVGNPDDHVKDIPLFVLEPGLGLR